MAVFRVHKIENYTSIDNNIFKNKNLSYKAKGLLCTMLSLNDNWEFSIKGLSKLSTDETRSTEAGLKELKNNGYLKVTKISPHDNCNKITYAYDVYEEPQGVQIVGVQVVGVQNVAQLNNNNKITIINNNTTTIYDLVEKEFGRPLSPIEGEQILQWEDNELTRYAIKQAVLNNKRSIKYIDKIIYNFKQANIKSVAEAQQQEEEYRNKIEEQKRNRENYYKPRKRGNHLEEVIARLRKEDEENAKK